MTRRDTWININVYTQVGLSLPPHHLPEENAERGAKIKSRLARPSCQRLPPLRVGLTCFGCSDVSNVEKHRGDLLLSTTLDKCVQVRLSPGDRNHICTCLNKSDATLKSNPCRELAGWRVGGWCVRACVHARGREKRR